MKNKSFAKPFGHFIQMLIILSVFTVQTASAQDEEALAKQLANPIASLISVPLQLNYDSDIGPDDNGDRYVLNIQPVIPISLNDDWNLISRTILPLISQDKVFPGEGGQSGSGDILESIFFSPTQPTANNWIWGAGPVFLLPTASDELLGTEKWGVGPTAVALKQNGPWTYGALANHIWSVAGDSDRADISSTFLQPFVSYTSSNAVTFSLNTESTYDWESENWTVPVNVTSTKVMRFGNQLASVGAGLRYWAEGTDSSPEGIAYRLIFTLLFPR